MAAVAIGRAGSARRNAVPTTRESRVSPQAVPRPGRACAGAAADSGAPELRAWLVAGDGAGSVSHAARNSVAIDPTSEAANRECFIGRRSRHLPATQAVRAKPLSTFHSPAVP